MVAGLEHPRDCSLSSSIKQGAKLLGTGQITGMNHSKVLTMLPAVFTHSKSLPTGKIKPSGKEVPLPPSFSWGGERGKEEEAKN